MTQRHKPHHLAEPCIKCSRTWKNSFSSKRLKQPLSPTLEKIFFFQWKLQPPTSVLGILDFTAIIIAFSNSMFIVRGVYCSSSFKVSNAYSYIHCLNSTGGTAYHEMIQILHRSVRSPVAQLKRFQSFSVYFCQSQAWILGLHDQNQLEHTQLEAKIVLQSLNVCSGQSCWECHQQR